LQLLGHGRHSSREPAFRAHARAFTATTETRPGLFEYADGGTVFLDEVGETSLAMQAKLLRAEVLAGRFREDLFYRLSSIQIRIPSLTERLEDIPLLVQFFLKKYNEAYGKTISGLTRRAQTALLQHRWRGNVRELKNVIASAAITTVDEFIDLADMSENLQHRGSHAAVDADWRALSLEEVRRVHIQRVLSMC
jgi:DNA-binding NtrC family response regulator